MQIMRRLFTVVFWITMLLSVIFTIALAESPDYTDDTAHSNFAGRLYIPEVNIDVALYRSNKQYVVDREDSAAYFDLNRWKDHMLVADHWNQGFATLKDVTVGMEAYIVYKDGTTVYYRCVEVFDGHNTGKYITDWNYKIVMSRADLLMYTCFDGWRNVKVTLWDTYVPSIDAEVVGE